MGLFKAIGKALGGAGVGALLGGGLGAVASLIGTGLYTNYQKHMQKIAYKREDTAVQRRVKDLKAAGLSPVLAAGSAASSSAPIPVYKGDESSKALDAMLIALDFQKRQADIGVTKAQKALINATLLGKEKNNRLMDLNYLNSVENRNMENYYGIRHGDSVPKPIQYGMMAGSVYERLRKSAEKNLTESEKKHQKYLEKEQKRWDEQDKAWKLDY